MSVPRDRHGERITPDLTTAATLNDDVGRRAVLWGEQRHRGIQQLIGLHAHPVPRRLEFEPAIDRDQQLPTAWREVIYLVVGIGFADADTAKPSRTLPRIHHHQFEPVRRHPPSMQQNLPAIELETPHLHSPPRPHRQRVT